MRIALGVEYDGTDFLGWQRLPHGATVQGALEAALSFVAATPIEVVCAGRTDAGVQVLAWPAGVDVHRWPSPDVPALVRDDYLPVDNPRACGLHTPVTPKT